MTQFLRYLLGHGFGCVDPDCQVEDVQGFGLGLLRYHGGETGLVAGWRFQAGGQKENEVAILDVLQVVQSERMRQTTNWKPS